MRSLNLDQVFNLCVRRANDLKHEFISIELVLEAILTDEVVKEVIQLCGADIQKISAELVEFINDKNNFSILTDEQIDNLSKSQFADDSIRNLASSSGIRYQPELSMGLNRILQRAAIHLQSSGKKDITGIHLLIALFGEEECFSTYLLEKNDISRSDIVQIVAHGIDSAANTSLDDIRSEFSGEGQNEEKDGKSLLDDFTVHLNERVRKGKVDPLIGREKELQRVVQVLCRRRKNNPLLVGEAGVGKTAIAEGLAWMIVNGNVPDFLNTAEVFTLDMASLLAGTKYRGDFEARFKKVMKGLEKLEDENKKPILFIDEIHTMMGAGATSGGGMDASNLLKPALANGDVRCMGSTTFQEYRKFIEKDSALTRRFQKIEVVEPTQEETVKILEGLKSQFEDHHGVKFPKSVLTSAVKLSDHYISDRKLPDKAIDVIDEIGASLQLLPEKKKRAQAKVKDVERVVAQMARVPEKSVSSSEKNKIKNLGRDLKMLIFGQDHAVDSVVNAIMLNRSGLSKSQGPVANFLFAGPTGVGKTELAKQLSIHMSMHFIRIDMSEYMEKHSVAKLIGAPPGYVGHDQGGILTEAVNQKPHSIVLLDEVEKAHPDVYNILLQVMDYGKLTDSNGRDVDFRNVILIMTTNAGAKEMDSGSIGLGKSQNNDFKRDQALKNIFTPEFRNRLDDTIQFNKLPEKTLDLIVDKFIEEAKIQLKESQVELKVSAEVRKYLGERGYDERMGARPISRVVESEIKRPLSHEILFGKLTKGGLVEITLKDGEVHFHYTKA